MSKPVDIAGLRVGDFEPLAAVGHMPFARHRTVAQVDDDEVRHAQLPWCPAHYHNLFRILRSKCGSAEAKRMIEEQMEADRRRSRCVPVAELSARGA